MMYINLACAAGGLMLYLIGAQHTMCMFNKEDYRRRKARLVIYSAALVLFSAAFSCAIAVLYTSGIDSAGNTEFMMTNTRVLGGNTGSYETGGAISNLYGAMCCGI